MQRHWRRAWVVGAIVVVGIVPVGLYWVLFGNVPTVTAEQAKEVLAGEEGTVLVDVRTEEEFRAEHVEGAVNWPYEKIKELQSLTAVLERLKGAKLIVICNSGAKSASAVRKLRELPLVEVMNVRGGMERWVATAGKSCPLKFGTVVKASGQIEPLAYRESPGYEQWVAVISGFVVKPIYMALAVVLAIVLWRAKYEELKALKCGVVLFFWGESFCAVNYLLFKDDSYLAEYLHSFGMVGGFAFFSYAVLQGADHWLIKYSDVQERCTALRLCRACIKYEKVACGLKRMFYVLIPAVMVLALMPITAQVRSVSYNTTIWGVLYNYSHPVFYQLYEIRVLPVVALLGLTIGLAVLLFKKNEPVAWSKVFFSAGVGALGFSMLRMLLYQSYCQEQVWFVFWEEITEFMFVAGVGIGLWIFQAGLLGTKAEGESRNGNDKKLRGGSVK